MTPRGKYGHASMGGASLMLSRTLRQSWGLCALALIISSLILAFGAGTAQARVAPASQPAAESIAARPSVEPVRFSPGTNRQAAGGKYDTDGDGLIEISNLEQLDAIRYDPDGDGRVYGEVASAYARAFPVAAGTSVCDGCSGFELTRSLDFQDPSSYASGMVNTAWTTGIGWEPIGALFGTLAGNGHTISNLYIKRPDQEGIFEFVGLFYEVGGTVREIGLLDVNVNGAPRSGSGFVGGLAGVNHGVISDSYVTGAVSGDRPVGGLVGSNAGVISGSYVNGSVSGDFNVGGLVGVNHGVISGSYVNGTVSGDQLVGGLVGRNSGAISGSHAAGSVLSSFTAGGLVGTNDDGGTVAASYATANVTAVGGNIGGLAGNNSGVINASYATGV